MELRRLDEWPDGAQGPFTATTLVRVDDEIRGYYDTGVELDRLAQGYSRIEFERTKDLLSRHLPPPPARLLDVGGGPGAYAEWLADAGYEVRLGDASPPHVSQAVDRAQGGVAAVEGDGRRLGVPDASDDAALPPCPLDH